MPTVVWRYDELNNPRWLSARFDSDSADSVRGVIVRYYQVEVDGRVYDFKSLTEAKEYLSLYLLKHKAEKPS